MTYTEALAYLDTFVNFERNLPTRTTRAVITLDRVVELGNRLGNPQDRFPIVHVAGTKGKGSTSAFAASIFRAMGLKTGLYTSPHLQSVRERISINGKDIPKNDFARVLKTCEPALETMRHPPRGERRPTYFEVLTHLAFSWFAEQKVDVAIIEVGLGGRLDATNIVKPVVCGITNISYDHVAILGDTLPQIASEKAGILKPRVPVICAPQVPEVIVTIEECARATESACEFVGREIALTHRRIPSTSAGSRADQASVRLPDDREFQGVLGLRGKHQAENWAVAVRLVDVFLTRSGRTLTADAVVQGSRNVVWPGRLELLPSRKKSRGPHVFLDGAHNEYSLRTVIHELRQLQSGPLVVVFGCAKDKDFAAMFRVLHESDLAGVVFTQAGNSRSRDPQELGAEWQLMFGRDTDVYGSCADAVQAAKKLAGESGNVLITGSLYLVGAIKDLKTTSAKSLR
jgi:dihydrofolate synthase / folylpolyglutamate synthase